MHREPGTNDTRTQIGLVITSARLSRGWSAQHLADVAGIAQKTVARMETGLPVRGRSWHNVSIAFELAPDAFLLALHREDGYADLAERLGVQALGPAAPAQLPADTLTLAGRLVSRLVASDRSPAADNVLVAVAAWLPELTKA